MTRSRTSLLCLALALTLTLANVLVACGKGGTSAPAPSDEAGVPVDPALLAFLSRAKAAHHIADQYEQDEAFDKAIDPLQRLVDGPAPGARGVNAPAEVREVLADTRARLADLKSQLGRFDAASDDIERGLELAKETTYFRGHLFEVRGLVEERRGKSLKDKGDEKAAEEAKKRALDAFEKSMSIQAEVIKAAVPEEDAK